MRARLAYLRYQVLASFWFIPGLLMVAAVVASFVTVAIDNSGASGWLRDLTGVYRVGPEAARDLLSTVAASMITVTSLVFSMTLVSLTLASQQLGPRLLASFMDDRVNQVVLGVFIATFVYALLVLPSVSNQEDRQFVPYGSLVMSLVLATASSGLLIYFVHHLATAIQVDTVVATVGARLNETIEEVFPEVGARQVASTLAWDELPPDFERTARTIPAERDGYVQAIDVAELASHAGKRKLILRLDVHAGDFVIRGTQIALAWPAEQVADETVATVSRAIVIGPRRTPTQDIDFAMQALVEVAVRALSPGVNDPYTACTCVDRLSAALAEIARRPRPARLFRDDAGRLRLLLVAFSFEGVLDLAFNEIRQSSQGNAALTIRLIGALDTLATAAEDDSEVRSAIAKHAAMLSRSAEAFIFEENDRRGAAARLQALQSRLGPTS